MIQVWVFSQYGMVSAVAHRTKPNHLMVRARDHESLEDLVKKLQLDDTEIYTDYPSDYPFRVVVTKREFVSYLAQQTNEISYPNFKSRVTKTRGQVWHAMLMRVWSATHMVTPDEIVKENRSAWSAYNAKYAKPIVNSGGKHAKKGKGWNRQGGESRWTESSLDWDRHFATTNTDPTGEITSSHAADQEKYDSLWGAYCQECLMDKGDCICVTDRDAPLFSDVHSLTDAEWEKLDREGRV